MSERVRLDEKAKKPLVRLILDSGAYSAYTQGVTIDIDEYCSYIKRHEHLLEAYFNLDVIPGSGGGKLTSALLEESAQGSYDNQQYMKSKGLTPIPVFHQGESFDWLERMLADKEPYLGISPIKGHDRNGHVRWFDKVFTRLTDRKGNPIVKTHGLGVASFDILKRYPWTTCDATSWALTAAFGSIYIPVYRNGKPKYDEEPNKITVSAFERDKMPKDHYLQFGPIMRERVTHFLEQEVGVSVLEAAHDYEIRARAIVFFFLRFQDAIGEVQFKHRASSFV